MLRFITDKILGNQNDREIKKIEPQVALINAHEASLQKLTDEELRAKTAAFRRHIQEACPPEDADAPPDKSRRQKEQAILNEILPEAFAVCREAARRSLGMRHFDVQLLGGIVLHQGKIAEMSTGEGKTLVATLAVYLNALSGRGVHLVTVNDYLAQRDCGWMGPVYHLLGLTCASIAHEYSVRYDPDHTVENSRDERMAHLRPIRRQEAYRCDITYGTNNEFGFDYLRDNMVLRTHDRSQRALHFAIVDEVDSILVDEARTPLIISGPTEASTEKYYAIDKLIPKLQPGERNEETKEESGDYILDEKTHSAYLTEAGEAKVARMLGVSDLSSLETMEFKHHVDQALRAHTLYKRDVHYVVKDGQVLIVDEFTGRLMPGRRWSDGLHQAVEAKEGVRIERENQTLATVTFQNYFRMYRKLAGMTGTALTEEAEFRHIYKLDVINVPTNRPLHRVNHPDVIYKTEKEKFNAVAEEIAKLHETGRPVLVGTISIEKSELLSNLLKRRGIPHNVLNAKYHEQEAPIIAQAGRVGRVTIATNMAGRGTDILLGGNADYFAAALLRKKGIDPHIATAEQRLSALENVKQELLAEHEQVVALGGLHIIGTERHEARRIDNQLRGRAGRQGDPGSSRFYLSLADDLMRIFASDRITRIMNFFQWEEGLPIEHAMVTKSIEIAQKRVETHNFEIRKQLLEYDNVMNKQREIIYDQRRLILEQADLDPYVQDIISELAGEAWERFLPAKAHPGDWDTAGLEEWVKSLFGVTFQLSDNAGEDTVLISALHTAYREKIATMGPMFRDFQRTICLHILDTQWKDHLHALDSIRQGIYLRAFGQKDPLVEYQHEAYQMFEDMVARIKQETVEFLFKIKTYAGPAQESAYSQTPVSYSHPAQNSFSPDAPTVRASPTQPLVAPSAEAPSDISVAPYVRKQQKVGRNDSCPCGSGKKFKKCCGA